MEATTWRGGCAHVKLSDFGHIYDLKNKRAAPQYFQKAGERRVFSLIF